VFEPLPLIDSAVAVGVLFGAEKDAVFMQFVSVRNTVTARRDIDAHLVGRLDNPCVLDAIGLACGTEPIETAVGSVVLPAVNDAVAVAVRFDANRPAVEKVRSQVDATVAIGVVVDTPDRAARVINRGDSITCACDECRAHQNART
jgi:hypothetical protein